MKCNVCDKSFESRKALKMHKIHDYEQKVKCKKCEETFGKSSELEEHIVRKHGIGREYDCDKCEKTFALKLRRNKHREGHDTVTKQCHYFNNKKNCPFENLGCMFAHVYSGPCKYGTKCFLKTVYFSA